MSVPLREREREREREMRLVHDSYMDVKNDAMSEHQSQPVEFNERVWLVPIGPQALRGPEGPRGPATPSGPDCRKNYTSKNIHRPTRTTCVSHDPPQDGTWPLPRGGQ